MGIREQKLSWEQEFSARKRLQLVMILGDSSRINMKQKLNSQIQHSVSSGTKKLKTRQHKISSMERIPAAEKQSNSQKLPSYYFQSVSKTPHTYQWSARPTSKREKIFKQLSHIFILKGHILLQFSSMKFFSL